MEVTGSSPVAPIGIADGAVAQLGERSVRIAEVRGSTPLGSTLLATVAQLVEHVTRNDGVVGSSPTGGSLEAVPQPRGVIGNTSDSGSEESWFEPRRGYLQASWRDG